jgi:hypothetical protein
MDPTRSKSWLRLQSGEREAMRDESMEQAGKWQTMMQHPQNENKKVRVEYYRQFKKKKCTKIGTRRRRT